MIDIFQIEIQKINASRLQEADFENLIFGRTFADHMLVADYKDGRWTSCKIMPYGDIQMSPAMASLHYGQSIFEGLKAQYNNKGEIVIFRPWENHKRMLNSAERMCMPAIPEDIFIGGMKQLVALDKEWIPKKEGCSLYIRPYMFASEAFLGVRPSNEYKFIIFCCPVAAYYAEPVSLKIETHYSRVAQGGIGSAKTAGNYAASLYPAVKGQKEGYHQLLWTNSHTHDYLEEVGTMNIMMRKGNTIITPTLGDTILRGITRDSVLIMAREWGYQVEERKISVSELVEGLQNNTIEEVFGLGTAAVVANVKLIHHQGTDYLLPTAEHSVFSKRILETLVKLKKGEIEDTHGWLLKI